MFAFLATCALYKYRSKKCYASVIKQSSTKAHNVNEITANTRLKVFHH